MRVAACGVCHTDLHYTDQGVPTFKSPVILGHEVSGTIPGLGVSVTRFQEGDRVLLPAVLPCGVVQACHHMKRGPDRLCVGQSPVNQITSAVLLAWNVDKVAEILFPSVPKFPAATETGKVN